MLRQARTEPKAAPRHRRPSVLVVIPTHNSADTLELCIDGALAAVQAYGEQSRVVVVNHSSTDNTEQLLRSRFSDGVEAIRVDGGTIAHARNCGAQLGREDLIAFLDSDCVVDETYLFHVVEAFARSNAVAVGSPVDVPSSPHWIEAAWHSIHREAADGLAHHINSGNFVVERSAFEAVGGFDSTLVTGEDSELCKRLLTDGGILYRAHDVRAIHLRNPQSVIAFFRKEVWHGLGMFGTASLGFIDLPVIATVTHFLFITAAIVVQFSGFLSRAAAVFVTLAMCWAVPIGAVAWRALRARRLRWPLRTLFLYQLYFLARIVALVRAISNGGRARAAST